MKRDAADNFVRNGKLETKQQVSISLTNTVWRSLKQAAQKQKISCSELIERLVCSEGGALTEDDSALADQTGDDQFISLQNQILEQQQAIAALQHENQHLKAQLKIKPTSNLPDEVDREVSLILENITDAFVAFNHDWRYTYVNQAATQILGKTSAELLGKHVWHEVFPELVGGIAYKKLHWVMEKQAPVTWEEFGTVTQRWLEARAYPSAGGVAVYFRDVTERKQSELERDRLLQVLKTERAQFEAVLRHMPAGVMIADASGKLILTNEQAKQIAGYDYEQVLELEEYVPLIPFAAFHADGRMYEVDEYPLVRSLRRSEVITNEEMEIRRFDGSRTFVNSHSSPILDQRGQIIAAVAVFQDVTERKEIEQALRRSESQLRALFDANLIGLIMADCQGNIREVNDPWLQALGYTREEVLSGQVNFLEITPPEYLPLDMQGIEELKQTGRHVPYEKEYIRKDGTRIPVLIGTVYLGEPEDLGFGFMIDLTERKRLESELEQQEQQFKLVVENAPDIISRIDRDLRHLYVSPSIEEITGIPVDQFVGKTHIELGMPEHVYSTWRTVLQEVFDTGQAQTLEFTYPTPTGVRWYQSRIFPEFAKDGSVKTVLNIARDVTDYKQVEQALRDSKERMTLALMAAEMVSWDMNLQTNWVMCSPNALDVWGRQEGPADDFFAIIHPDDRQQVIEAAQKAVAGKIAYNEEYRIIAPDGTVRWLNSQGRAYLDEEGRGMRMFGVSVDTTERKAIEADQAQARQQIEQLLEQLQRKEQQQQFLIEVNDALRALQDPKEIMWQVVCTTGQYFQVTRCTYGEIDLAEEYVIVDRDYCNGVISVVGRHQMNSFGPTLIAELKQGKTVVVDDVDRDPRMVGAGAASFDAIQTKSLLCVPLVKESRFVALLVLHHVAPRQWTEDDVAVMERVAEKTWLAVERSRAEEELRASEARLQLALQEREQLLERERIARAEAEAAQRAQQFLSEASAVLASSLDYQTTLEQVAQLAVPQLADWCTVHIVQEDGSIEQIAIAHIDPAKLEWAHKIQHKTPVTRDEPRGASFTLRTGQSDLIPDIPDEMLVQAAKDEEHLEILRQVGFSSVMTVPLRVQTRIIGVISFIAAESGRRYHQKDLQLAEELAYRASLAIDNAQLYQVAQRDRAKAESANRIKDEFLAVLSHELRSPLNPILGWTKLLRAGRLNGAKTEQALETIERNAKLQAQLIEDLLDVSRILRGKMTLNVAPVNLVATIEAALETVRLAAEAKAIDLQFADTSTHNISVMGDSARLQQVIWNLLSNAVKFTPDRGKVEVKLESVEFPVLGSLLGDSAQYSERNLQDLQTYAQITVTDTGKGISSEFLPFVFDYFRQEDGTTTRQFGGLGLGLAIVRHFTELHGGTVWADSLGHSLGATFTLRLPLHKNEKTDSVRTGELSSHSFPDRHLLNLRILVVDDDADMRELAAYTLTQAGAEVATADSATQALVSFEQFAPNLLLCDIGMPETDGYDLIRQIRRRSPEQGGTIPAIALTAYAGEMNQQQALSAGFQLHVSKPVEPEKLVQAISSLLSASH